MSKEFSPKKWYLDMSGAQQEIDAAHHGPNRAFGFGVDDGGSSTERSGSEVQIHDGSVIPLAFPGPPETRDKTGFLNEDKDSTPDLDRRDSDPPPIRPSLKLSPKHRQSIASTFATESGPFSPTTLHVFDEKSSCSRSSIAGTPIQVSSCPSKSSMSFEDTDTEHRDETFIETINPSTQKTVRRSGSGADHMQQWNGTAFEMPTEARVYYNFNEFEMDHQHALKETDLVTRLDRYYTGGCQHYDTDHQVKLCALRTDTEHFVRIVKTTHNPHLALLVFDHAPDEPERFFSIGLMPKDLKPSGFNLLPRPAVVGTILQPSGFNLLRRPAIIGTMTADVTDKSIAITRDFMPSPKSNKSSDKNKLTGEFLLGGHGNGPTNVNLGRKVVFPNQEGQFSAGFIKDIHISRSIDMATFRDDKETITIEVAFAETRRKSLDEVMKSIFIKSKFFKWTEVEVPPSPTCPDRTGFWKEIPNPAAPEVMLPQALSSDFENGAVTMHYDRDDIEFLEEILHEPFLHCDHSVATMLESNGALEFDSATPIHRITAQERHALLTEIQNIKGDIKYHNVIGLGNTYHSGSFIGHLLTKCVPGLTLKYTKVEGELSPNSLSGTEDRGHLFDVGNMHKK